MEKDNIFTITVTGANHDVRTFITDCSLVLAHTMGSDEFDMSLNISADVASTFMLVMALDQTKRHILESNSNVKELYELAQMRGGEEDA